MLQDLGTVPTSLFLLRFLWHGTEDGRIRTLQPFPLPRGSIRHCVLQSCRRRGGFLACEEREGGTHRSSTWTRVLHSEGSSPTSSLLLRSLQNTDERLLRRGKHPQLQRSRQRMGKAAQGKRGPRREGMGEGRERGKKVPYRSRSSRSASHSGSSVPVMLFELRFLRCRRGGEAEVNRRLRQMDSVKGAASAVGRGDEGRMGIEKAAGHGGNISLTVSEAPTAGSRRTARGRRARGLFICLRGR